MKEIKLEDICTRLCLWQREFKQVTTQNGNHKNASPPRIRLTGSLRRDILRRLFVHFYYYIFGNMIRRNQTLDNIDYNLSDNKSWINCCNDLATKLAHPEDVGWCNPFLEIKNFFREEGAEDYLGTYAWLKVNGALDPHRNKLYRDWHKTVLAALVDAAAWFLSPEVQATKAFIWLAFHVEKVDFRMLSSSSLLTYICPGNEPILGTALRIQMAEYLFLHRKYHLYVTPHPYSERDTMVHQEFCLKAVKGIPKIESMICAILVARELEGSKSSL